jgi:parallel beta-helix repeat protein
VNGNAVITNSGSPNAIVFTHSAHDNTIQDNVISGNSTGIYIDGGTSDPYQNTIKGNKIGTNAAGTAAITNNYGVQILSGANTNTIGGTTAADRNIISGNTSAGVLITGAGTDNNTVSGNYIGTNFDGTADLGNTGSGVLITSGAQGNTVGGDGTAGDRNVISGNNLHGVEISVGGTDGNFVTGNYIGTNATGTGAIANGQEGVKISNGAANNEIGGDTAGERNVISGNTWQGVYITGAGTTGNKVMGNYIGTNYDLTGAVANGTGIRIASGATGNIIGGASDSMRNIIAYNTNEGIKIASAGTNSNEIKVNLIHSNQTYGVWIAAGNDTKMYHNTIHNSGNHGVVISSGITGTTIRNNIITGNSGFGIWKDPSITITENNNLITDAVTNPANTSGQSNFTLDASDLNVDPLYYNPGNDYYTLQDSSPARNSGLDLGVDQPDMNGASPGNYSGSAPEMGAYEVTGTNVYYSVGQNTSDHKTGAPTVKISGGVATFSVAQTASNMGVGDRVTYNGGSVAYISGKMSSTQWTLVTATGGTPADESVSVTVNSIAHEFASLSAAEAGAADINHLNTSDLVAGDYVLNLACYYDTGADTTTATVDGWTTGANNYIRIYTPTDTATEVNQSQRHDGKYNAGKYELQQSTGVVLFIKDNYVRVEGLQVRSTSNAASNYGICVTNDIVGAGDIELSHNYVEGSNNTTGNAKGIYVYNGVDATLNVDIWNNIIYNVGASGGSTQGIIILDTDVTGNVYNNTQYKSNAFWVESNNIIVKNNILSGGWYIGAGYSASSTNNAGTHGTPPGSNPITLSSTDPLDYFVSASDLHINTGATFAGELIDAGIDPSGGFSDDVDGETRSGTWDVGADEFIANNAPIASDDPGNYNSEILSLSPFSYWRLGEGSGPTAVDGGSSANNGTYNGGTFGQSGSINGDTDTSIHFDGATNYIAVSHSDDYLLDEGAVQLWFNADSIGPGIQGLFSKDRLDFETGGHLMIYLTDTGLLAARLQSATAAYNTQSAAPVSTGQWHHVAFTFGADGMKLYLDGVIVDTNAYTGGLGTTSGDIGNYEPIILGASNWDNPTFPINEYFLGYLDEVALFGNQLSAEQIEDIFAAGLQDYTVDEDSTLIISAAEGVLINDYDSDSDPLSVTEVNGNAVDVGNAIILGSGAQLTLNADGSFNYDTNGAFDWVADGNTTTDTFNYTLDDENSGTDTATVTITITGINDAPFGGHTADDVIPQAQISQATDGSGIITIDWKGRDPEAENVTLKTFQYSDDGGSTWYTPNNGDSSGALSANWDDNGGGGWSTAATFGAATAHSFIFNTQHADVTAVQSLDNVDQNDIQIRFILNDGSTDSVNPATSEDFRVDNEAPTVSVNLFTTNDTTPALTGSNQ